MLILLVLTLYVAVAMYFWLVNITFVYRDTLAPPPDSKTGQYKMATMICHMKRNS